MTQETLWQTKVAARLHDPVEKALVLMRDPEGHENGTSLALARLLGLHEVGREGVEVGRDTAAARLFRRSMPAEIYRHVQRADWWAAAADRPQWPMKEIEAGGRRFRVAPWAQVHWTGTPTLIHPLTGEEIDLKSLRGTEVADIRRRAEDHFTELLLALDQGEGQPLDWRQAQLTLWRFGPELGQTAADTDDFGRLGALWQQLPADTRIPDHSIWDHLDLTSAFAGAFAGDPDGEAALLSLSIGPVQSFIAAARKMDDLWAGSHLLSRLAWEAMRPLCEALGPDAILFPRLRGIPQVDLWLRKDMRLPDKLFKHCTWQKGGTDANPLFSAALPNRFVAVVPASQARELAEQAQQAVRQWLQELGEEVVTLLLTEAGHAGEQESFPVPFEQMKEQLAGFPEVHWAAVPFSLIGIGRPERQTGLEIAELSASMRPFFEGEGEPGFLGSEAWQVLQKEVRWENEQTTFFEPNPGVLYPAIHDLAERALAAARATRPFDQIRQEGWRCSLTGEAEWLTTHREQLSWTQSERQQQGTLWTRIAERRPAWARKGEHLGGLAALKRLWPTLFLEEVNKALGSREEGVQRFVVSTHTMALAGQLDDWLESGAHISEGATALLDKHAWGRVALPPRLMRRRRRQPEALENAARLPALLDAAQDSDLDEAERGALRKAVCDTLATARGREDSQLEAYYSLLMMDGDRMGAILAGDEATGTVISYRESFHPQVRAGLDQHGREEPRVVAYGQQPRAISPARHLAISGALNDFSQIVARHVVEQEHLGRLIYAGGDDVLAMLPVVDLLPAMERLRHAYSGTLPEEEHLDWSQLGKQRGALHCRSGFAWLDGRLMRMMGRNATASCGAVIAHHQAPLTAVMAELRRAEQRAKQAGRNAFSLTVIKRSGGALYLTEPWGSVPGLLSRLRAFLAAPGVSRRAVYHTLAWLQANELPAEARGDMLASLLTYQLSRQVESGRNGLKNDAQKLAEELVTLARSWPAEDWLPRLRNLLAVAEFLAREVRSPGPKEN